MSEGYLRKKESKALALVDAAERTVMSVLKTRIRPRVRLINNNKGDHKCIPLKHRGVRIFKNGPMLSS
jgi:hypothetical protein